MGIQPISAVGREEQDEESQYDLLAQSLKKQEESRTSLTEMIQDAREKADAQREKFKLAKVTPRYGDAPLEAYARLSRAKTQSQVSSAAGTHAAASPSWRRPRDPTQTTPTRSAPPWVS